MLARLSEADPSKTKKDKDEAILKPDELKLKPTNDMAEALFDCLKRDELNLQLPL